MGIEAPTTAGSPSPVTPTPAPIAPSAPPAVPSPPPTAPAATDTVTVPAATTPIAPIDLMGDQGGLRPPDWTQGTFLPRVDATSPLAQVVIGSTTAPTAANQVKAAMSFDEARALAGADFATVSAQVQTPEDVALFLRVNMTYDDDRAGSLLSESQASQTAEATLAMGSGVCRDQHTLGRELLQAAGYEAATVGYNGPGTSHAITAYRDPETGYWGVLEYGTVYSPATLQARTAEEAVMLARPEALLLMTYSDGGADDPARITGFIYTPNSRAFERFMAGPSAEAGTGLAAGSTAVSGTVDLGRGWQTAARLITDPRTPALQGAVMVGAWHTSDNGWRVGAGGGYLPNWGEHDIGSNVWEASPTGFGFAAVEGDHPALIRTRPIAAAPGLQVRVGSHLQAQGAIVGGSYPVAGIDTGAIGGISSVKWSPTLSLSQGFTLAGRPAEAELSYRTGIDGGLLFMHYWSGGGGFPSNHALTATVTARPGPATTVRAGVDVPLVTVTNDFANTPQLRLEVATPRFGFGTTQGLSQAQYDARFMTPGAVRLEAWSHVTEDRRTRQVNPTVGVAISANRL